MIASKNMKKNPQSETNNDPGEEKSLIKDALDELLFEKKQVQILILAVMLAKIFLVKKQLSNQKKGRYECRK